MEDHIDNLRREPSGEKNIRFLGYKFLQEVRFSDEPVVPKILSEAGLTHSSIRPYGWHNV